MSVAFTDHGATSWVTVEYERSAGGGTVVPRLIVTLQARATSEHFDVEIHSLTGRLSFGTEVLGESSVSFTPVSHHGNQINLDIFLTRDVIGHINRNLRGDYVELLLDFNGLMRVKQNSPQGTQYASSPPPGEWTFLPIGRNRLVQLPFRIPRSEWFKQVLQPIELDEYVLIEIRVPKSQMRSEWQTALKCLHSAENQFLLGNDPEVFFQCRAALESLPGAPKRLFDGVLDEEKGHRIDELVRQVVQYLHFGRHVGRGQEQPGFGVDHKDAEFALGATKVILGYASKLLPP